MAPTSENKAFGNNSSWKRVKKEEKKVKRLKAKLTNVKSETTGTLRALEELHLSITQIREIIRPLLPPDCLDAQLTAILLAGNNGDL
ncbi:hypothetical protein V6N13_142593 [Hibiscus sabdariffa]|uniref:Uncharacterized protein n=1 Tax=Hibiscus sabdariffa TaxID=183260 RepID=A0ABR2FEP7_9ROSI